MLYQNCSGKMCVVSKYVVAISYEFYGNSRASADFAGASSIAENLLLIGFDRSSVYATLIFSGPFVGNDIEKWRKVEIFRFNFDLLQYSSFLIGLRFGCAIIHSRKTHTVVCLATLNVGISCRPTTTIEYFREILYETEKKDCVRKREDKVEGEGENKRERCEFASCIT